MRPISVFNWRELGRGIIKCNCEPRPLKGQCSVHDGVRYSRFADKPQRWAPTDCPKTWVVLWHSQYKADRRGRPISNDDPIVSYAIGGLFISDL